MIRMRARAAFATLASAVALAAAGAAAQDSRVPTVGGDVELAAPPVTQDAGALDDRPDAAGATANGVSRARASGSSAPSAVPVPAAVTTLTIDTRPTGVDLGLRRDAEGSIVPRSTAGSGARPALRSELPTAASSVTSSAATSASGATIERADALGGPADVESQAPPGTGTLGNASSAGRVNGNSGTDNGRSTATPSGGTGVFNSGTPGNGLASTPAPGVPGATGSAAAGTPGAIGSSDADTAANAAAASRSINGTGVTGRIVGAGRSGSSGIRRGAGNSPALAPSAGTGGTTR
jgi:hypothetical protein